MILSLGRKLGAPGRVQRDLIDKNMQLASQDATEVGTLNHTSDSLGEMRIPSVNQLGGNNAGTLPAVDTSALASTLSQALGPVIAETI